MVLVAEAGADACGTDVWSTAPVTAAGTGNFLRVIFSEMVGRCSGSSPALSTATAAAPSVCRLSDSASSVAEAVGVVVRSSSPLDVATLICCMRCWKAAFSCATLP